MAYLSCNVFRKILSSPVFPKNPLQMQRWHTNQKLLNCAIKSRSNVTVATATISPEAKKLVGKWLLTCSGMVFGTVVLGGVTRLTKSGLSMVDWHLFKEFPPRDQTQWEAEFAKYQQFPEFKQRNKEMSLSEFKWIWWMEYIHRSFGRAIGAVYYLPAAYFWYRGWFNKGMKIRAVALGGLLAAQGLLGWYMVKSGLEEKPEPDGVARVSQYRLAAHLGTAFIFYSLLLWNGLAHITVPEMTPFTKQMKMFWRFCHGTKTLIFLAAFSGAFVAGIEAGLVYNSFPKMADRWIPTDIMAFDPKLRNFTENPTTVQFDHRILGELVFLSVTSIWIYSRKLPLPHRARLATNALLIVGLTQVGMGIGTLLLYVPKSLAACHQAGALTLLSVAIWLTHELKLLRKMPK